jgi:hypothetical protein
VTPGSSELSPNLSYSHKKTSVPKKTLIQSDFPAKITRTRSINEASKFSSFCFWTRTFFLSARGSCLNLFALALFALSHHRLSSTHTFLFCLYSLCERAPRADSIQFLLLCVSMRRRFSFDQRDKIIVAASEFFI